MKMIQVGAISGPHENKSQGVHDLNVSYEGPKECGTPTADMLFPPTSSIKTPVPRTSPYMDFLTFSAGKRKREDFASQYYNGRFIVQQDGAGDTMSNGFQLDF